MLWADGPSGTVEEFANRLTAEVAHAAGTRGHPEPGELFLMVLLKV